MGGKPAQIVFAEVAKTISKYEPVTVCVNEDQYSNAFNCLDENIRVVEISNNDSWIRDCGATFVTNGKEIRGVDWEFNAWGGLVDGLYFPWDKDDKVAQKMCEIERKGRYRSEGFVLEGGSIHVDGEGTLVTTHVDGEGTLVTTEECLLSEGRNKHLSKKEIEEKLKDYLGIEKVIWLKRGIYNDETNGHVDNIFSFVKPGEAVLAWTENKNDPQYEICQECLEILENEKDAKGREIKIHKLLLPEPIFITKEESKGVDAVDGTLPRTPGDSLAASYANFYIVNKAVIFPIFNDPNDEKARETLKKAFPDREIVGIYAREILLGGGNIHCITQQIPEVEETK